MTHEAPAPQQPDNPSTEAEHMAALTEQVLTRFAEELAQALGSDEMLHLARRAEGLYATDLGQQMRDLVDAERYGRIQRFVALHMHLARCGGGCPDGVGAGDVSRADEILLLLGWQAAVECMHRWAAAGYTCDWRDLAYGPTAGAR